MNTTEATLLISSATSAVIAVAVSYFGYRQAKSVAKQGHETALAVAKVGQETAREHLRVEATREHTASFLAHRREAYEHVLAAFSEYGRLGQQEDFDHDRYNEIYNDLGVRLPALALFGRPVYEDVHLWQQHLATVVNTPRVGSSRLNEAHSTMHDLESRISETMSKSMGADLSTL